MWIVLVFFMAFTGFCFFFFLEHFTRMRIFELTKVYCVRSCELKTIKFRIGHFEDEIETMKFPNSP